MQINAEHTVGPASKDVPESTIAEQPPKQKPGRQTTTNSNSNLRVNKQRFKQTYLISAPRTG